MNSIKSLRCRFTGHEHQRTSVTQHVTQISCASCNDIHIAPTPSPRMYRIHTPTVPQRRPSARIYGLTALIDAAA